MVFLHNHPSETEPQPHPPPDSLSDGDAVDSAETAPFSEDLDSACSTPYVSAPSSPGRGTTPGYFYSAPASPMHFVLLSSAASTVAYHSSESSLMSSECDTASFEFSSRFSSSDSLIGSMSSADELFFNGQIKPMKLSSHLQKPQILAPLLDLDVEDEEAENQNGDDLEKQQSSRGRDLKLRSRSLHRKARSLSPLRNPEFQWPEEGGNGEGEVSQGILDSLQDYDESKRSEAVSTETTPSCSASSSRSSSSGRNSKKWIFLKDLLYRSKSEGRGNGKEKFWSSISFSPSKEKKPPTPPTLNPSKENKTAPSAPNAADSQKQKQKQKPNKQAAPKKVSSGKPANGIAKRRVPPSAHELHYTVNRAQAEEMKKRTYLPYRHGLFGCLAFSSKGYGALSGLARTLNPVSSG
ncbi:hypothetical protein SLE2022_331970 [Rubroshorea leprosula]